MTLSSSIVLKKTGGMVDKVGKHDHAKLLIEVKCAFNKSTKVLGAPLQKANFCHANLCVSFKN